MVTLRVMARITWLMPMFVIALGFAVHPPALASPAVDGGGTADTPTSLIPVSLTAVREAPSRTVERALRANVLAFDNPRAVLRNR